MDIVVVVWFMLSMFLLKVIDANPEVDALIIFKNGLSDPDHNLQDWDPTQVNPCTWFHVKCYDDHTDQIVQQVNLGLSNLEGPLVSDLQELTRLQQLELYGNKINGSIPIEIGTLTELVNLDLYDNSLTGTIPKELSHLKQLKYLRLYNNKLTGKVPDELKDLPSIQVRDLSGNPGLCGAYTNRTC